MEVEEVEEEEEVEELEEGRGDLRRGERGWFFLGFEEGEVIEFVGGEREVEGGEEILVGAREEMKL